MADYFWKAVGSSTDPTVAGNWVNSSGVAYGSEPDSDDIIHFTSGGNKPCNFTNLTKTYAGMQIHSDIDTGTGVTLDNTDITLSGDLKFYGSNILTVKNDSTITFTGSFGNAPRVYYPEGSDWEPRNGVFTNSSSRSNLTIIFNGSGSTTFVHGIYPNITFTGGNLSPTAHTSITNNYSKASILDFNLGANCNVQPYSSGATSENDLDLHFSIEGELTLTGTSFKWGKCIFELAPYAANKPFPFDGNIANFGGGTPKTFRAEYYDLRIIPRGGSKEGYFTLPTGAIINCNSFYLLDNGRIYGSSSGGGAEIHCVRKPDIKGDWNFQQISKTVYRTIGAKPLLGTPFGGTGLGDIGTSGQVLAVKSNGTELEWSSTAGGGGLSTLDVVATDSGYTWGTNDITTITNLKVVAGANVTLATDTTNKALRITSTDTNTTYSAASTSAAGLVTALPNPHGGKFLRGDNTWVVPPDTDTTYTAYAGATSPGTAALVPARDSGSTTTKYLREDGDWVVPPDTDTNTTTTADVLAALNADWGASKTFGTQSNDTATFSGPITSTEGTITGILFGTSADNRIRFDESNDRIHLETNATTRMSFYNDGTVSMTGKLNVDQLALDDKSITVHPSNHNTAGQILTIRSGDTTAGTTDNIAGGNLVLAGGAGKGNAAGGKIVFKVADSGTAGVSGFPLNPKATAMTINANKSITMESHLTIDGNLTVNGTETTVDTATLSVEDPLIILASGNSSADSIDIGFYGLYNASSTLKWAGLFRDASDGKFRLFKDLEAEPSTTVNTSGTGYAIATLVANLEGTASSATTATTATNVVITDNENTDEDNAVVFVAGADVDGSTSAGLESDGNLTYNPSTGQLSATKFAGDGSSLTGLSGNATTSAVTVQASPDDEFNLIPFIADAATASGNHALEMDAGLKYNPSTNDFLVTGMSQNYFTTTDSLRKGFDSRVTQTGTSWTGNSSLTVGARFRAIQSGAVASGETSTIKGIEVLAEDGVGATNVGVCNVLGGTIEAIGTQDGSGATTATGLKITTSGADTNYGLIVDGGKVGVGVSNPYANLTVDGNLLVSSSGDTADPKVEGILHRITNASNDNPDMEIFFVENHGLGYGFRMQYDGTNNRMRFFTHDNNTSGSEVMRFNRAAAGDIWLGPSGSKVIIGATTSPVSLLHLEKTAYDFDSSPEDGDFHLMLKATESSTTGDALSIGFAQTSDATTVGAKISHLVSGSYSRGHLIFSTNNTASGGDTTEERMRITDAGNVGIGNTTPSAPLVITADTDGGDTVRIEGSDANGNLSTPDLALVRTNGSPAGNTWLGHIHFKGMNNASGTNEEITYASIAGQVDAGTDGSEKGRLKFFTMVSGTHTQVLTIDENKVGIGTGDPAFPLDVSGWISTTDGLVHTGDTNNTIQFDTDIQKFNTGGSTRLTINDKEVKSHVELRGNDNRQWTPNSYTLGVANGSNANKWIKVCEWVMDGTNYDSFSFHAKVTQRGNATDWHELVIRGEFATTWWTKDFNIHGPYASASQDNYLMVFDHSSGGSNPKATLYYRNSNAWNKKYLQIIQNVRHGDNIPATSWTWYNTTTSSTNTPTTDGETNSSTLSPDYYRTMGMGIGSGANDTQYRIYDGTTATPLYLDTGDQRVGIGTGADVKSPLHIRDTGDGADQWSGIRMSGAGSQTSETDLNSYHRIFAFRKSGLAVSGGQSGTSGSRAIITFNNHGLRFFTNAASDTDAAANLSTMKRFEIPPGSGPAVFSVPVDITTGAAGKLLELNDGNTSGTYMGIAGDRAQVGYSSNGVTIQGGFSKGINFAVNNATFGSGIVATFDTAGTFNVVGAITAATKEFVIPHPTKKDMQLHHGSLEGPEHAVYVRGQNNASIITLPDYWEGLVDEDTITVQLTPIGEHQELFVKQIKNGKVRVASKKRNQMLKYFYFIQGERKDVEKLEVEV